MLKMRIIPCLDVLDNKVVKGIQFQNHRVMGDIVELAQFYDEEGADELVFYDISASPQDRVVDIEWVQTLSKKLRIPFSVAGGIRSVDQAKRIIDAGAEKISINSMALKNPEIIGQLAKVFGSQAITVGIDSRRIGDDLLVNQYTGDVKKTVQLTLKTEDWAKEVCDRGAGEIVLNCMNADGTKQGYDLIQLTKVSKVSSVPIVASGGAGAEEDFVKAFAISGVTGALAASVFHSREMRIPDLKNYLSAQGIPIRKYVKKGNI